MTPELDPGELVRLRAEAENPLIAPSRRVAARLVLRELRDAERAKERARDAERLGSDIDAPLR